MPLSKSNFILTFETLDINHITYDIFHICIIYVWDKATENVTQSFMSTPGEPYSLIQDKSQLSYGLPLLNERQKCPLTEYLNLVAVFLLTS